MVVTSTVPHFIPLPPTVNRYRPINGQTGQQVGATRCDSQSCLAHLLQRYVAHYGRSGSDAL